MNQISAAPTTCGYSDSQLVAALAAARGEDGAAGPGAHPLAETVDLSPPTVVRLESTLAHWNSRYSGGCPQSRADMSYAAASRSPDISQGSTADATWVSLFTVRGIRLKVKLKPQHRDFHNASTADDLGCGKSWLRSASGDWHRAVGWGNRSAAHYTPCG